jgi:hypothetical protein
MRRGVSTTVAATSEPPKSSAVHAASPSSHLAVEVARVDATLDAPVLPAPPLPAINFATEWLDKDGRVCPKNVDYATQCPKGHALVSLGGGGGGAQAQQASGADVMCRVCHASTPRQHAFEWLVCGVAGCCGGYAVCASCVGLLACSRKAVAAIADDFCMMVCSSISPLGFCLHASVVL